MPFAEQQFLFLGMHVCQDGHDGKQPQHGRCTPQDRQISPLSLYIHFRVPSSVVRCQGRSACEQECFTFSERDPSLVDWSGCASAFDP
jgi:hypothetical protein